MFAATLFKEEHLQPWATFQTTKDTNLWQFSAENLIEILHLKSLVLSSSTAHSNKPRPLPDPAETEFNYSAFCALTYTHSTFINGGLAYNSVSLLRSWHKNIHIIKSSGFEWYHRNFFETFKVFFLLWHSLRLNYCK